MTSIDLALVGARVRTLDPEKPWASAVALAGGTIAAVGSDAEIRELAGGDAVDADDLRVLGERPRAVDAGQLQRPGGRERRVEVHEGQQGRGAARRLLDERPRCARRREGVVVQAEAQHPLAGRAA